MDRNELLVEPRHIGVPWGASKTISEPQVLLVQIVLLSCIQTDRNEIPYDPRNVGVPYSASKMISEPIVCTAQSMHLSCVKITTMSKQTKRAAI
jgi:hypothetical protein